VIVKDIAFAAYPANDVAATRRWYETNLGMRFAGPYIEDGEEKYNEAHLPTSCFALTWAGYSDRAAGSASGVTFAIDDIDNAVASLEANGITIDERFDGPVCRSASFRDPEGNKLTIHESRSANVV